MTNVIGSGDYHGLSSFFFMKLAVSVFSLSGWGERQRLSQKGGKKRPDMWQVLTFVLSLTFALQAKRYETLWQVEHEVK